MNTVEYAYKFTLNYTIENHSFDLSVDFKGNTLDINTKILELQQLHKIKSIQKMDARTVMQLETFYFNELSECFDMIKKLREKLIGEIE